MPSHDSNSKVVGELLSAQVTTGICGVKQSLKYKVTGFLLMLVTIPSNSGAGPRKPFPNLDSAKWKCSHDNIRGLGETSHVKTERT